MTGTLDQTAVQFSIHSPRAQEVQTRLRAFMDEYIYPNEAEFAAQVNAGNRWEHVQLIEDLKPKAREAGLWNLFLPRESDPDGPVRCGPEQPRIRAAVRDHGPGLVGAGNL